MKMLTVSALVCAMMVLTGAAESHLVKRSVPCSSGWLKVVDHWFRYVPQAMTWAEAEKNCQSLGGNLASIHSYKEYRMLRRLMKQDAWVGGTDAQEKGQWLWSDGTPFNYYKWCQGEPRNVIRQNCLQIKSNPRGIKCWDDLECFNARASFCIFKYCPLP